MAVRARSRDRLLSWSLQRAAAAQAVPPAPAVPKHLAAATTRPFSGWNSGRSSSQAGLRALDQHGVAGAGSLSHGAHQAAREEPGEGECVDHHEADVARGLHQGERAEVARAHWALGSL
eukprot:scaffold3134_cov414-Prasinococcus_capsulatus_cf.AAC.23